MLCSTKFIFSYFEWVAGFLHFCDETSEFPKVEMGRDFQDGVLSSRLINKWHFNWAFVLSGHQMVHECWLSGFFFPIPSSCRIFSNFRRQVLTPWISEENLVEFQWRKADWTWTNSSTGCFCANWPSNHWNEPTRFIQIKWTNKFISNMSSFPSIFGRNSETRRQWNAPSDWASSAPATAVTIYPTFYSSSHDLQSSRSTLSINMKSPTEFHLFVGREWDDRRRPSAAIRTGPTAPFLGFSRSQRRDDIFIDWMNIQSFYRAMWHTHVDVQGQNHR